MNLWKEIKNRFLAIVWFYKMCHNKRIYFLSDGIWNGWNAQPEDIFTQESLLEIKKNLDMDSCRCIDNFIKSLSLDLKLRYLNFVLTKPTYTDRFKAEYHRYQKEEEKELITKGIPVPFEETSAYFHHGMRFLPASVKNYVKNKIFIDGGACFGDSSLIFQNYSPKKVLAFDISEKNADIFRKVMKKNHLTEENVLLIQKGLGEKYEELSFEDGKGGSTTLNDSGKTKITIIPLDACREIDSTVGWIKFDLEGFGLYAFKGMIETIKRDRPVLTLAVYHNPDEFFGIKKLLESLNLNYKITFKACSFSEIYELTLIAYPAELDMQ